MIFNPEKHVLGKLCKYGHDYQGTGLSLRNKKSKGCVECRCNCAKGYQAKNKDKVLKYRATYRRNNPDKIREKDRLYRIRNNERMKAKDRLYYKAHRERAIERSKIYRAANPDKVKAWNDKYRAANPDKVKASNDKNRAAQAVKNREASRQYRLTHPDRVKESNKKYHENAKKAKAIVVKAEVKVKPKVIAKSQRTIDQDIADLKQEAAWFNNLLAEIRM